MDKEQLQEVKRKIGQQELNNITGELIRDWYFTAAYLDNYTNLEDSDFWFKLKHRNTETVEEIGGLIQFLEDGQSDTDTFYIYLNTGYPLLREINPALPSELSELLELGENYLWAHLPFLG